MLQRYVDLKIIDVINDDFLQYSWGKNRFQVEQRIYLTIDDSRNVRDVLFSVIASERASERAKNREGTARLSAAAKNEARLRNHARCAQQSDDLPLWKG
jgi:hypothetical protein